ncbi:Amidophosphoribosyltransferase (ATASE) [Desulfurococcus amylolyticus 1221n]|uniref:Amidophosphoribosyltransferase (ATASE) n=1 Tax=Desulfurococcus amylolyticus (strain DSM 18924 / JCM 16383 / VKM B-2413 / 1221n) TaxID=490899 RepID=B8D419_DESA1|nr:phosphoribosyltransferase family protein [Desulfurococcus amylolyticus]ACL10850.1 Amidophosphoribosyltransferase (ATASE) [Desulfurococcus amylolyticus 1221n]
MVSGLLSIYAFDEYWDVSSFARYGLLALKNRGDNAVICYSLKTSIECIEASIDELVGKGLEHSSNIVIAGVYNDRASYYIDEAGRVAILLDRESNTNLVRDLVEYIDSNTGINDIMRTLSNSVINPPVLMKKHTGIMLLSNSIVVAWRGPESLSPLALGGYGFDMAIVASETAPIEVVGGNPRAGILPGQLVLLNKYVVKVFGARTTGRVCLLELLYTARPDSVIDGIPIYMFRKKLGEKLAEKLIKEGIGTSIDVVIGVPETALPYALGISQRLGKPLELLFVSTGVKARSMLKNSLMERAIAIHLKMNPVKGVVEGKRVLLVDDSVVSGSTLKTVIQGLRQRLGVEEVHVVIASPPIRLQCPYSLFYFTMNDLISANMESGDMVKYLDADSITWIPIDVFEEVMKSFGVNPCFSCFIDSRGDHA